MMPVTAPLTHRPVSADDVTIDNLFVSRSPILSVSAGDIEVSLLLSTAPPSPIPASTWLLSAGDHEIGVSISADALRWLIPDFVGFNLANLPISLVMAIGEISTAPLLKALSGFVAQPAVLEGIAQKPPEQWRAFGLRPATDETAPPVAVLYVNRQAEGHLVAALQGAPSQMSWPADQVARLAVYASIGSQAVGQGEIATLVPGSVVLIREFEERVRMMVFSGPLPRTLGYASLDGAVATMETVGDIAMSDLGAEDDLTVEEETTAQAAGDDVAAEDASEEPPEIGIDDLEVRLDFVAGRTTITFEELRQIAAGTTIALDVPSSSRVDIFASGRKLGEGELVDIDGSLGVRVLRINGARS